jgi:hypothetical protein
MYFPPRAAFVSDVDLKSSSRIAPTIFLVIFGPAKLTSSNFTFGETLTQLDETGPAAIAGMSVGSFAYLDMSLPA